VAKKGWLLVSKHKISDNLTIEASNNNSKVVEQNLFKLFTQSINFVTTNIQPNV
jgi:hypothetical protein